MVIVYVLINKQGLLYKGVTSDLDKRLWYHNNNLGGFTKYKGPWRLIYKEDFITMTLALKRERFFKSGKGREYLKKLLA